MALALMVGLCPAQEPASQPDGKAVQADRERLSELIALIEGQNSPQVRRTGARELLRQGWSDVPERLAAVLRGSDGPAKVAVASALSGFPQSLKPVYVEPLLAMLADPEPDVRQAASQALAAYHDGGAVPHLRALILDEQRPLRVRLAAIDTLGLMTQREAIHALVDALADPGSPICEPALAALERATALGFKGNADAARTWWQRNRDVPLAEWQRIQIQRLVAQSRAHLEHCRELEARLVKALREAYLRAPEAERPALLGSYLNDASPIIRLLALDVVQAHLAEGKTLPAETVADVRKLLADAETSVRAAAVGAVASLRDARDGERFSEMLAVEDSDQVRQALINGLGYVGTASSSAPLLKQLKEPGGPCVNEAVTALGRLAERGVLDPVLRRTVATALLAKYRATRREELPARERLLWAMSRVADRRCGRVFVEALDAGEAVTVRQAAVQGITVLADPQAAPADAESGEPASAPAGSQPGALMARDALVDALAPATRDPDVGVRKAAVETLARLATSDAHLQALWGRLPTDQESDEPIRELAWRGALRVLAGCPGEQVESWIARLPENGNLKARRELELLQVAEQAYSAEPNVRAKLGRIRSRIAAQRVALGQPDGAAAAYVKALEDLGVANAPELPGVAVEFLRFALLNRRYDEQVAAALAGQNPRLNGKELWEGIRAEIEQRVQRDSVDQAIGMLAALQAHPPASMPADVTGAIEQLLKQARELKARSAAPASQPQSAPATQGR